MGRKGNTNRRGHGYREYTSNRHCSCGRGITCPERRHIRHMGGDENKCMRCNAAVLILVG